MHISGKLTTKLVTCLLQVKRKRVSVQLPDRSANDIEPPEPTKEPRSSEAVEATKLPAAPEFYKILVISKAS
jgi:hypothetical protein